MRRGELTIVGGPREVAREMRRRKKAELARIGRWWHQKMLPRHFTPRGEKLYGMQPRSPGYSRYKAKRFGHRNPLEFRGDMKRQVLRRAGITSTSKGVRVALRGPRYLYQYRRDYRQPDKAAELTATAAAEEESLSRILDRRMSRHFNGLRTTAASRIQSLWKGA